MAEPTTRDWHSPDFWAAQKNKQPLPGMSEDWFQYALTLYSALTQRPIPSLGMIKERLEQNNIRIKPGDAASVTAYYQRYKNQLLECMKATYQQEKGSLFKQYLKPKAQKRIQAAWALIEYLIKADAQQRAIFNPLSSEFFNNLPSHPGALSAATPALRSLSVFAHSQQMVVPPTAAAAAQAASAPAP